MVTFLPADIRRQPSAIPELQIDHDLIFVEVSAFILQVYSYFHSESIRPSNISASCWLVASYLHSSGINI